MNQRIFNLMMLLIWLGVGVGLLFRNSFLAEEYRTPEWARRLDLAMFGAFVLVAWNLVRYSNQRSRQRQQEAVDREGIRRQPTIQSKKAPEIVNPEFDFFASEKPPEPPLNGKHSH